MDDIESDARREQFRKFKEAIVQRVHDIGVTKGATTIHARGVEDRLFRKFHGDPSQVTDEDISTAYDEVLRL